MKSNNFKDNYSWFNELTPDQFSKAYKSHQTLVQQKRAYSKRRRKLNRKWRKWYLKYLNSLTYDTVIDYCRNDVEATTLYYCRNDTTATTNIKEAVNNG